MPRTAAAVRLNRSHTLSRMRPLLPEGRVRPFPTRFLQASHDGDH